MTRLAYLLAALLLAVPAAYIIGRAYDQTIENGRQLPPISRCEEDMPCWDCTSMGNLICGKDTP